VRCLVSLRPELRRQVTGLAVFLIAAGEMSYYGCSSHWSTLDDPVESAWHAEYEKPLGTPLGLGVKDADGVWTREFAGGPGGKTYVVYDSKAKTGSIAWNGEPHPPPPPPPPPPVPPVPPQCGKVLQNMGQANAEISMKGTASAAACCAYCAGTTHCAIWAWHTKELKSGMPACHVHTAAATRNPGAVGCFSGVMTTNATFA